MNLINLCAALGGKALTALVIVIVIVAAVAVVAVVTVLVNKGKKRSEKERAQAKRAQKVEAQPRPPKGEKPVAKPKAVEEPVEESTEFADESVDEPELIEVVPAVAYEQDDEDEEENEPETEDEEVEKGYMELNGKQVRVIYRKSFLARLIQSSDEAKERYAYLTNLILSYGAHGRLSWNYHSFNTGRNQLFKLSVRGKTLCLYMAYDPAEEFEEKYKVEISEAKKYAKIPCFIRIKSSRKVKYAEELIENLCARYGLTRGEDVVAVRASDYPYDTTENLIKRELIKFTVVEGVLQEDSELVQASVAYLMREKVTAEEAHDLLTDKTAKDLVKKVERPVAVAKPKARTKRGGRRYAVNVDTLSDSFAAGDTVDLNALKGKGIVPKSEKAIKILARGTLDKPLTVIADDYSADAVKMIVLTGGTALKN